MQGALSSRHKVLIHDTWPGRPQKEVIVEKLQGKKGWVVETVEMRVNFVKRKITVKKIPYAALRAHIQTWALMQRLIHVGLVKLSSRPTRVKFKISLGDQGRDGFDRVTTEKLELMDEMCRALGLAEG